MFNVMMEDDEKSGKKSLNKSLNNLFLDKQEQIDSIYYGCVH